MDKQYQFVRMPFGFTSAPNTWARLVTDVLSHIPKNELVVFFDDPLVHSASLNKHLEILEKVMKWLSEAGLRINLDKSNWLRNETKFLVHIISAGGISVPKEFTDILQKWHLPETLKQLRSFAGKCNYYQRHIQNYAILSAPLMQHLKGTTKGSRKLDLKSDPEAIRVFENLKKALISLKVLAYPDFVS